MCVGGGSESLSDVLSSNVSNVTKKGVFKRALWVREIMKNSLFMSSLPKM